MKTTNWNAVVASTPLNADAAKTMDATGEGFVPRRKFKGDDQFRDIAPPKMRKVPGNALNITGMKVGKLTVIGMAEREEGRGKKAKAAWVVRCACGMYETRSARVLRDPQYALKAACSLCSHTRDVIAGLVPAPSVKFKRGSY